MPIKNYEPRLIRWYNRWVPNKDIEYYQMIDKAQKKIEGFYFDSAFVERLRRLCQSVNEEAALHPFGRFMLKERLSGILLNHLRAKQYLKQNPSILKEIIAPPILITGLQRTGTTYLQRLLAATPEHRALQSWEALNPIPFSSAKDPQKRIRIALNSQRALRYISPIFFSIHPVEYNSPEEEILLNDMTLLSAVHEATMHVPSYAAWLSEQDHRISYEWMKNMLQVLQFGQESATWVLKTPQHLEYMDVVCEQFPRSLIIHLHRQPIECLPSFCSMVYHSRRIFSHQVNPKEVAQHWLQKNASMLEKTLAIRAQNSDQQFMDIYYSDLVKAPLETVQKIYHKVGKAWTPSVESAVLNATKKHQKNKYGKHHYSLEDYGLHQKRIEEQFSFYIDHYFSS